MEMLKSFLYLHLDLGTGPTKIRASNTILNDGAWHQIDIVRDGKTGSLKVDGDEVEFETPGRDDKLEVDGPLYVGGIDMAVTAGGSVRSHHTSPKYSYGSKSLNNRQSYWVPPVLWTATLRQGFVGCFRDLSINGRSIDVADYAKRQDSGKLSSPLVFVILKRRFLCFNYYYYVMTFL